MVVQVASEQERLIAALIKDGFPPKQAQAVAVALLQNLAERNADDPVLKAAESLLAEVAPEAAEVAIASRIAYGVLKESEYKNGDYGFVLRGEARPESEKWSLDGQQGKGATA